MNADSVVTDADRMSDFEICKSYRESKNPSAQVKILVQMNCKTTAEIFEILKANNEPIRKRQYKTKTAKKVKPKGKEKVPAFLVSIAVDERRKIEAEIEAKQIELTALKQQYDDISEWLESIGKVVEDDVIRGAEG